MALTTEWIICISSCILYTWFTLFPSREMASIGLTPDQLFSSFLTHPNVDFIGYHSRLCVLNRAAVYSIPLGYLIIYSLTAERLGFSITLLLTLGVQLFTLPLVAYLYHYLSNFRKAKAFEVLAKYEESEAELITLINEEARNIESLLLKMSIGHQVTVTENWLLVVERYNFFCVKRSECDFEVVRAHDHNMDTRDPTQILHIEVITRITGLKFRFWVNTANFHDLELKLGRMIPMSPNIQLQKSMNELFTAAFNEEIEMNGVYNCPPLADDVFCLGCSIQVPNVKLVRGCDGTIPPEPEGEVGAHPRRPREACRVCNCPPLWCATCMSRIFIANRRQTEANQWMTGQAACPTCRAPFCILDVRRVEIEQQAS